MPKKLAILKEMGVLFFLLFRWTMVAVVNAISGLVAEVRQQMEECHQVNGNATQVEYTVVDSSYFDVFIPFNTN